MGVVKGLGAAIAGLIGILFITVFFGSWFTVDQGEVSVVLRNGAYNRTAEPGLNFKLPIIESAIDFSLREEKYTWEKLETYSHDNQLIELRVTSLIRPMPNQVDELYVRYGTRYVQVAVSPVLQRRVKEIFGRYDIASIIGKRQALGNEVEAVLQKELEGTGIHVVRVQVEDIQFSKTYEHAIEQAMQAEAEVRKVRQQVDRQRAEAEKTVVDAEARAKAQVALAEAEAKAILLRGTAEAGAIAARADALKKNADLVSLYAVEKWDGKLPVTMIPGSVVPFIGMK